MDYSTKEDIIEYIFDKVKFFIFSSIANYYRSRFLKSNALLFCVVLLLVLKIVIVVVPINFPQNIFFASITKTALKNFANQTRQSSGLQPLLENQKLNQAAELKAANMVKNNYFEHTSPTGISPWYWFLQAGYNYKYAGENLAIGFYDSEEVYSAWLNSPEHRANILNPNYKEVGTAVLGGFGPNNAVVVVQEFGSQKVQPITLQTANTNSLLNMNAKEIEVKKMDSETVNNQESESVAVLKETVVSDNFSEKVLSKSTESQSITPTVETAGTNTYYKIMNSVLYDYSGLLQDIIYGVSLVVIGILLLMIFFNDNLINNVNFEKKLVFRSVLIVILLSLATALNKELIISIIPHQIII
jgi:hypothetical protein